MNPSEIHSQWEFLAFVVMLAFQCLSYWRAEQKANQVKADVRDVHSAINGRLTQLLESVRAQAYAEGHAAATRAERAAAGEPREHSQGGGVAP